ncbi:MAG: cell division protein SepF [Eubacteriales bacterium]
MANLFDKFIGIMGFGDDENEEELVSENYSDEYDVNEELGKKDNYSRNVSLREPIQNDATNREVSSRESGKRKAASVVSIHTQKQVKVIVIEPSSFEEAQNIADHLKLRKAVIINLENAESNLAQRIVDFSCGTTYALGGNMQKVGNGIFIFVPNNVDIGGELNYKMTEREVVWPKVKN